MLSYRHVVDRSVVNSPSLTNDSFNRKRDSLNSTSIQTSRKTVDICGFFSKILGVTIKISSRYVTYRQMIFLCDMGTIVYLNIFLKARKFSLFCKFF